MTRELAKEPDTDVAIRLRGLESKMGLVLTLVRVTLVWLFPHRLTLYSVQSICLGRHQ
jgi:hypothetical protein